MTSHGPGGRSARIHAGGPSACRFAPGRSGASVTSPCAPYAVPSRRICHRSGGKTGAVLPAQAAGGGERGGPVSWATAAAPRARSQLSPPGPGLTSLPPSARLPQRRVLRKSARGPREARRSESLPPGDAVARQPPPESALRPSPALGPGRSPSSGSPGPRREAPAQAGARSSGARGALPRAGCDCGCDPVRV